MLQNCGKVGGCVGLWRLASQLASRVWEIVPVVVATGSVSVFDVTPLVVVEVSVRSGRTDACDVVRVDAAGSMGASDGGVALHATRASVAAISAKREVWF